jgi:hypothetical protein
MFNDPPELLRQEYAGRLERAEQDRLTRKVTASHPHWLDLLRIKVGDLLITIGTRLEPEEQPTVARQ